MNFLEALQKLKEGNKIRRRNPEESYWMFGVDEAICWKEGKFAHIHSNQILANDWEIFKKKITCDTCKYLDEHEQFDRCSKCNVIIETRIACGSHKIIEKEKELEKDKVSYECDNCKHTLNERIMGSKCPKCGKWNYTMICRKNKTLSDKRLDNEDGSINQYGDFKFDDVKEKFKEYLEWLLKDEGCCGQCKAEDKPKCKEVSLSIRKLKLIFGEGLI